MNTITFLNERNDRIEAINTGEECADLAHFHSRLSHALATLKISQTALAKRIGVTRQAIQYLCRSDVEGKRRGSTHAFQIAQVLEISPAWLILGQGEMRNEHS